MTNRELYRAGRMFFAAGWLLAVEEAWGAAAVGGSSILEINDTNDWAYLLAGAVLATGLAWLASRRLRSKARHMEERRREIFELAPVQILVEDFSAAVRELERLRSGGVTDLAEHLRLHPDLTSELFRTVRLVEANRLALTANGCASANELEKRLPGAIAQPKLHAAMSGPGMPARLASPAYTPCTAPCSFGGTCLVM